MRPCKFQMQKSLRCILTRASPPSVHHRVTRAALQVVRDGSPVPVLPSVGTPTSAYIHMPFCKKRCFYCDFPVAVVGKHHEAPAAQDSMEAYIDLLCREIRATSRLGENPLQTIFFGGGTPSLVPPKQLERVISLLATQFGLEPSAEISMEADPGTFDVQRLRDYMNLGVSRFSVGVQAFQQELLEVCGRSHGLDDVRGALEAIHAVGVPSWSLDLMCGLPTLTREDWQASLAQAIAAAPDHISVYDLQVEERTPFARRYTPGESPLPSESQAADMYRQASLTLRTAGYEHYEISNYAKPVHRCRHNMVYWDGRAPYYAFGLGAASYLEGRRFSRPKKMGEYRKWVDAFAEDGAGVPGATQQPVQGLEEQLLDVVMLRLRRADGLDLDWVAEAFGRASADLVQAGAERHVRAGLAQIQKVPGSQGSGRGCLSLTDPEGFLVSNDIISDIFACLPDEPPVSPVSVPPRTAP